ncbi:MAG: DUF4340 domain-containing protein [Pirellulaceae bacterium]|nr:DUF4340 domain-containing protein [Pirellulaceae bacterium]
MNEGRTTAIFAGVAAVTLALAFWSMPEAINSTSDEAKKMQNMVLFDKFDEPSKAASLQIVKYNESLGQLDPFEISKDKGGMWKIPSHDDYPADAAEQVRDAATPLIGLKSLDVVTIKPDEHAMYGVLNPDDKNLKVGESGVGMLVRVKDSSDKIIADLIIGKEDKGRENQRFVRKPSEDAVYIAELSVAPFTTEFRKWIKGELLGVKSFDITSIMLRDYAILPTQNGGYGMRKNFDADLSFDPTKSAWSLDRMLTFEDGPSGTPVTLTPEQELKASSLNDLRTAVQGLEIVNVRRKPKGLAADLKADKSLMENKESLKSLYDQGFFPQEGPNGPEIYATGGETIVGTQNGVQYVLRFGEAVAKLTGESEDKKEGEIGGLQRYLLVTAKLDESKFPIPDIQPLPETIEDLKKLEGAAQAAAAPAESAPSNPPADTPAPAAETPKPAEPATTPAEPAPSDKPAEEPKPEEPKAEEPKPEEPKEPAAGDEPKPEDALNSCVPQDAAATQEPEKPAAQEPSDKPAEAPATDKPATEPPATDKPATEAPAAATQTPDAKPAPKQETEEELKERLEATRERIAKENQRKIDDRNEKIATSRKKVQELNARFSDWYYVVSDTAYKKLKISRDQLIVPKGTGNSAPPAGGVGLPPGFPGGLPAGFPGNN